MGRVTHVSVRELRNHGGQVLDRVATGETFVVTRDGAPVAELRPVTRGAVDAATLLARWRRLPRVDSEAFRRDLDELMDPSL